MTTRSSFPVGSRLHYVVTFTDSNDAVYDPTGVTIEYKVIGVDTVTTLTYAAAQITRVSAGVYSIDLEVNTPGQWAFRAYSPTGTGRAATYDLVVTITPTRV